MKAIVRRQLSCGTPPSTELTESNVGERTRKLTYALFDLADELAALASSTQPGVIPTFFSKLSRKDAEWSGWPKQPGADRASRHIPRNLPRDRFVSRCGDLVPLSIETLIESSLRRMVVVAGVPEPDIKEIGGSLKLLELAVRLARLGASTGLNWSQGAILFSRIHETSAETPVARLFALYALRLLSAHLTGSGEEANFAKALAVFGIKATDYSGDWGPALDAIYDGTADAIEEISRTLSGCPR